MILVEDLYSYENCVALFKEHFISDLLDPYNSILPLNNSSTDKIMFNIASKDISRSKSCFFDARHEAMLEVTIGGKEVLLDTPDNPLSVGDLQVVKDYMTNNNISSDHYIFCGSRDAFSKLFKFDVYSPSVNQFLVAVLKSLNCINFIGRGKGSFVIFKPVIEFCKDIFSEIIFSRKVFFNSEDNMKYLIDILRKDSDYYLKTIKSYSEQNHAMQKKLQESAHQNYLYTQMTWR